MLILKIVWAFVSVGLLGALLGTGLAVASRYFGVKKDKRIEEVVDALPGLNCGACGYAGCDAYAEAILGDSEVLTLCKPGGAETVQAVSEIMGVEVSGTTEKQVTQVHCRGGRDTAKLKYDYQGISDCNAAYTLFGGNKECPYGCLLLGSCIKVCPVDAIDYDDEGLVWVDREVCISCGKCVDICPTKVMRFIPYSADRIVACNSTDKGAVVRKYCKVGCIACRRCVKESPEGGFEVNEFLARIDYLNNGDRSAAEAACPTNCIIAAADEDTGTSSDAGTVRLGKRTEDVSRVIDGANEED